ncbi:MAG: hypothetical protein JXC33_08770, partial [Deltaproteobacteria bacterium]|nr:hypothetical protein [Deltaproteobacteria bacterium]
TDAERRFGSPHARALRLFHPGDTLHITGFPFPVIAFSYMQLSNLKDSFLWWQLSTIKKLY